MQLDYRMPTERLSAAISIFGHVHRLRGFVCDTVPALLPNLHVRLCGTARYAFGGGGGEWRTAPRVTLIGATSAAFRMEMSADYEMLCIGFLPEGWSAATGLPAASLADDLVDAALVWPQSAVDALWTALVEASDLVARQRIVEQFVIDAAGDRRGCDARRVRVIRNWLEQPGAISLDTLAGRMALSPRQIARLTLDAFGASPKTLAMKYRALRTAGSLTVRGHAGMAQAIDGYADQSHMIRDFHRFVGWSPGHFLAERHPLARATMLGRWEAGARSPMVLCS